MGYTHYWYKQLGEYPAQWAAFAEKCRAIVDLAEEQGTPLAGGLGDGRPEITEEIVWFNGLDPDGYETFHVDANQKIDMWSTVRDEKAFGFCKTGRMPYDRVVTACLIALKCTHGDLVVIDSDGSWAEWGEGVSLFEAATGIKVTQSVLGREKAEA